MIAREEILRLEHDLAEGNLHPDEPLFVLRGRDLLATVALAAWIQTAKISKVPAKKIVEAQQLLIKMNEWPVKRIAGRPETQVERKVGHHGDGTLQEAQA